MQTDYSKGKIYNIRFYDNNKLVYIGSTIQSLAVRFGGHKRNINCSLYKYIIKNYDGNFRSCYIELIELFVSNSKEELNKREGEVIRKFKADENYITINQNIAGRTLKQYYIDNTDKLKQYRIDNTDKQKQYRIDNNDNIKEYQKQYYIDNTDKLKQYYIDNTDKLKEYQKQYRIDNTDKLKQYRIDNTENIKEYQKQYYINRCKTSY